MMPAVLVIATRFRKIRACGIERCALTNIERFSLLKQYHYHELVLSMRKGLVCDALRVIPSLRCTY